MWLNCRNCGRKFDYNGRGSVHGRKNLRACCPSCGSSIALFKKPAPKFVKPAPTVAPQEDPKEEEIEDIPSIDDLIPPILSYTPEEQQRLRREAEQEEGNNAELQPAQPQPIIHVYAQPPSPPKTPQELYFEELKRRVEVQELAQKLFPVPKEGQLYGLDLEKLASMQPNMAKVIAKLHLTKNEEFQDDLRSYRRDLEQLRQQLEDRELFNSFCDAVYHYCRLGKRDFVKAKTGMPNSEIDRIVADVNAGKVGNKFSNADKFLKRQKEIEKMKNPTKFLDEEN